MSIKSPRFLYWNISVAVAAIAIIGVSSLWNNKPVTRPIKSSTTTTLASVAKLPQIPLALNPGAGYKVMVPFTSGEGSQTLRSYTPHGAILYVQYACSGPGSFTLTGYVKVSSCQTNGTLITDSWQHQAGHIAQPRIIVSSKTKWEIVITSGPQQPGS